MFHLAHNCLDTNCLNGVSFPVLSVFVDFCGFKSNELAANTNKIIEIQTDQNEKKRRKKKHGRNNIYRKNKMYKLQIIAIGRNCARFILCFFFFRLKFLNMS